MGWSSEDQNPTMGPSAAYGGGNYAAQLNAVSYNPLSGGSSSTGMAPTTTAASSAPTYADRLNATNPAQPKTTSQALAASARKPQPAEGTRAAREIQAWGGGGSRFEIAGNAAARGIGNVDHALTDIIQKASEGQPYNVQLFSGMRPGDKRQHGRGNAVDIALVDPYSGEALPNYQSADTFPQYETFAKRAYEIARRDYPDLADSFRWGGYFGGGKGKYGATDTMHFDVNSGLGMAGGSFEDGLTEGQQRRVDRMGAGSTRWAGLRPGTTAAPPATMVADARGNDRLAGGNMPPDPRMRPGRTQMAYAPAPEAQAPFDAVLDPSADRRPQPPTPRSRPQRDTLQAPAPTGGEYVVQRGDNLTKIARQAGVSVQALARANGIRNPDQIDVGQRLVMPGGQAQAAAAPPRREVAMPSPRNNPRRDPNGFPIDVNRPAIYNPDGSISTERTITFNASEVGGPDEIVTVPTIINGRQVSEDEARRAFAAGQNPAVQRGFSSFDAADQAAQGRTGSIEAARATRIRGSGAPNAATTPNPRMRPQQSQAPQWSAADQATEVDANGNYVNQPGAPRDPASFDQSIQLANDANISRRQMERYVPTPRSAPRQAPAVQPAAAPTQYATRDPASFNESIGIANDLNISRRQMERAMRPQQPPLEPGMDNAGLIRSPTAQERALQQNARLPLPTGNQPMDPRVQQQINRTPTVIMDPQNPQPRVDMGNGDPRDNIARRAALEEPVNGPPDFSGWGNRPHKQDLFSYEGADNPNWRTGAAPSPFRTLPEMYYDPAYGGDKFFPARPEVQRNYQRYGFPQDANLRPMAVPGGAPWVASNGVRFFAIG